MVGEDTQPQVVIGKALMKGVFHRSKVDRSMPFLSTFLSILTTQDVLQAVQLLGTVSQDAQLVAFRQIVLQGLPQQVEVLMELGLRADMEGKAYGILASLWSMLQENAPEAGNVVGKL